MASKVSNGEGSDFRLPAISAFCAAPLPSRSAKPVTNTRLQRRHARKCRANLVEVISLSTPTQPADLSTPSGAASSRAWRRPRRGVLLWSSAVAMVLGAAAGAWWETSADDETPVAVVAELPSAAPASAAAVAGHPREQCAGRHVVALHRCLLRECAKPEHQAHRECQRVRDLEVRTRSALGG
jgi:hypothetical protein